MCGIFGVQGHNRAVDLVALGLYSLQHRGQESVGISFHNGEGFDSFKKHGDVESLLKELPSDIQAGCSIGHVRYSTTGGTGGNNIQPFEVFHKGGYFAVAHNGNLINTGEIRTQLENKGAILQTKMDTEVLLHLLLRTKGLTLKDRIKKTFRSVRGAYSVLFMIDDILIAGRDSYGIRPLILGELPFQNEGDRALSYKQDKSYVVASETCAFDIVGASKIQDLEPGEFVIIYPDGRKEHFFIDQKDKIEPAPCSFEDIYFSRPDSLIENETIADRRKQMGRILAREAPVDHADVVVPVPDSGNFAALGFAMESKVQFDLGIVRNHYVGRTFIDPSPFVRAAKVRIKLNPIQSSLRGKVVVVVEDSIVRGTTIKNRIESLRACSPKEIHLRISCPKIVSPCFYGIDFPDKNELIAVNRSTDKIREYIGVDTLSYLSVEGLLSVYPKDRKKRCIACFTGDYPLGTP